MFKIKNLPPGLEHIRAIDTLRKDFLPGGRLPTIEEIVRTFKDPKSADPRLVAYCYFRPEYANMLDGIKKFYEIDSEGEEWKYS